MSAKISQSKPQKAHTDTEGDTDTSLLQYKYCPNSSDSKASPQGGSHSYHPDSRTALHWLNEKSGKHFTAEQARDYIGGYVIFNDVTGMADLGTLGGYALARSGHRYSLWILIAALVFRAMPHITLVSGYMLPFFELNIWGYLPTLKRVRRFPACSAWQCCSAA